MKLNYPIGIARLMGAALLALGAGATTRADYQATVVSQGPIGFWRLNETASPPAPSSSAVNAGGLGAAANGEYLLDATRGVPGALTGSSDTATRFSNPTNDVTFVNSKVDVPYIAELNPQGPFTVEVWAKPVSTVPDVFCVAASMQYGGAFTDTARAGWLFYQTAASTWQFRMGGAAGYTDGGAILGGTVTPGQWHHLVGVYDGTTARLYVNGVEVASGALAFEANLERPLRIGGTTFTGSAGTYLGNRGFNGDIDEFAFYGGALDAATIKAHYDTGTASGNAYPALVLAAHPLGYWRLGEPGNPGAENLGTLGASGNGTYIYTAKPGQPGPTLPGFGPGNVGCEFDGASGYVHLPALNLNTNVATITAWVKPDGVQTTNAAIVFSRAGTTVAGLKFDVSDPNGLSYNWNNESAAANFKSSLVVPAGQWSFVAMIIQPETATLCIYDGSDFTWSVNYDAVPGIEAFDGATRIGSDAADPSLTFKGIIDEVAFFNRALGIGEVYSQYADAVGGQKPLIFAHPQAPTATLYEGDTLTLSVDAGGSTPLSYQWRRNGTAIGGANSATLTKVNSGVGDTGNYDVVISNGFGSETSQAAPVSVEAVSGPSLVLQPVGATVYPGGTVVLTVEAMGGALSYEWQKGGVAVPGATTATLTIQSAQAEDAGEYKVLVSNRVGTQMSDAAIVNVIVPPTGTYEALVVADGPEAWWRLDEPALASEVQDAMGRHPGTVKGDTITFGAPGALLGSPSTSVLFDGTAGNVVEIPYSAQLNTPELTVECWARTTNTGAELAPVSSYEAKKGYFFQRMADWAWWGCTGDDDQYDYYYGDMGPGAVGKWTHLVMTYGTANDDTWGLQFYLDGVMVAGPYTDFVRNAKQPFLIGGLQAGDFNLNWNGEVDEVAVYAKALTPEQIADHYVAALYGTTTKPQFVTQPLSGAILAGGAYSFTAKAEGSLPITLQWHKNGAPIDGATDATLTVSDATAADAGSYKLVATNPAGTTESDPATLSVLVNPSGCNLTGGDLVLHLNFEDNYLDTSGRGNNGTAQGAPTFVVGAIGGKALHYSTLTDTNVDPVVVTAANYITLGNRTGLQFGTSQDFSISFWVRLPAGASPGDLPFFCNATNAYTNPGYTFAPSYKAGGWSWGLGSVGIYGPGDSINDGEWHHLVHTFDRTGSGITYLDGVRVDIRSAGSQDLDTGFDTCIGQDPTGLYPEAGEADIDDLGVWRRVLTPEEALCIYAVGVKGVSFDTAAEVKLASSYNGSQIQLSWPSGTLQEADAVNGTWTNVSGASAPSYTVSPTAAKKFYRVKL